MTIRTVTEPVEGSEIRVEPRNTPGITVNGIPADVAHVKKADVRVDLLSNAHSSGTFGIPDSSQTDDDGRSFVVEHALGPLGLCGVTAANVSGVRTKWAFERPEHRFCYSCGLTPSNVVGHPAGLPNPEIVNAIRKSGIVEMGAGPIERKTVTEPVTFSNNDGSITLHPRDYGTGIRFDVTLGDESLTAQVDPSGDTDVTLIDSVTNAKTPYIGTPDTEAITHSIADLVSDVAVIGGFDDLVVDADLGGPYHELTIGVARKAHSNDVSLNRTE